jgi:hypothetical protein
MTHTNHIIVKCRKCDILITQCRCMDKNKPVIYDVCSACRARETPKPKPWGVYVDYAKGHRSLIERFEDELAAFRFKQRVEKEFWVMPNDYIYVKEIEDNAKTSNT